MTRWFEGFEEFDGAPVMLHGLELVILDEAADVPWDAVALELGRAAPRKRGETMEGEHILQFFEYEHLPAHLQAISRPFCELARAMVESDKGLHCPACDGLGLEHDAFGPLPRNPERTVALRKLLEAKDAAVRAKLAKPGAP